MKKVLFLFTLIFLFVPAKSVLAQEENSGINEDTGLWEAMNPGPMHEMLSQKVGKWEAEVKLWMDPSQPPIVSKAKTVCEPMLGGRYFKSVHTGEMMGMPFEGYEINGYDNLEKKFFSIWLDNMGTGYLKTEGSYDETNKTLNLTGKMKDPMGNNVDIREVVKMVDNDNTLFEMYMIMDGKEVKSMEINYKRVD